MNKTIFLQIFGNIHVKQFFWVTGLVGSLVSGSVFAIPFTFSTGTPDGRMATASQPGSTGIIEIESADDFVLNQTTSIDQVTFTGLITRGNVTAVNLEIYRVFPNDSNTVRTIQVPTRVNSPSDVAFELRDGVNFSTSTLNASFTALNSVVNGIHPSPNQQTGGEGPVTGAETLFSVNLANPFLLTAGHYFFVPQVQINGGEFLWLSAPKPIVSPGTPFSPDLQSWIRNENLSPDWLRIGTDIVGGPNAPTFNAAFSLSGTTITVPEPGSLVLVAMVFAVVSLSKINRVFVFADSNPG